jgi:hypothetical protein
MSLLPFRVSQDDVVWCYRNLLNRPPESEAVVKQKLHHVSFRSLVEDFVSSNEFQQRSGNFLLSKSDVLWCYENLLGIKQPSEKVIKQKLRLHTFKSLVENLASTNEFNRRNLFPADQPGFIEKITRGISNVARSLPGKATPRILIGVPVKNCASFLENLGLQLAALTYEKSAIDVALVVGDSIDDSLQDARKLAVVLRTAGFRKVFLQQLNLGYDLPHSARHIDSVQAPRLRGLAITRQFIIDSFLGDHDYVWWVDADYEVIPPLTLQALVDCKKDFVIPNLRLPDGTLYDHGSKVNGRTIDALGDGNLHRLDIASAHAFISASVFAKAGYLRNPAQDHGIKKELLLGKTTFQEGDILSIRARAAGFELYVARNIVITHTEVNGMVPLMIGDKPLPQDYRSLRIRELYLKILRREPDSEGFWHYYNGSLSTEAISLALKNSPEASQLAD